MTKYLVRGLYVSAQLGMYSKEDFVLIRGCKDRTMEDVYLLLLLVQYQNAKEPVSQLDARVMPHFLSTHFIDVSKHTQQEWLIRKPFTICTVAASTIACWSAAVAESDAVRDSAERTAVIAIVSWSSTAWKICSLFLAASTTATAARPGCSSYGDSGEVSCGAPSCVCEYPDKVCYGIHGQRTSSYRQLRYGFSSYRQVRPQGCGIMPRKGEPKPVPRLNVCWG